MWFILNRHRFGEHMLFIGDSNNVSRVVGIDVDREKIKLFTLMGGLAGLAAIFLTLENKNYFGNQGQGYLLIAIASVLIGGTSIFGGRATIIGTVFGCFIIAMVEPGLVATGLTGAWVNTVRGLIFLDLDHLLSLCRRAAAARAPCLRACAASRGIRPDDDRPMEPAAGQYGRGPVIAWKRERTTCDITGLFSPESAAHALLDRRRAPRRRSDRQRPDHVHADGRQCRRRRDARPPDRRHAGGGRLRRRSQGAVLGLGAGDHDQPVQGRGRGQADCIEIMGHPGRHRLP